MSDVLRWVADQYRSRLFQIDRDACHEIDRIMVRAGQSWITDQSIVDPDELVTAKDVQERFGYDQHALWALIRRYGIETRGKRGSSQLYRLGDLLSARAARKTSNNFPN